MKQINVVYYSLYTISQSLIMYFHYKKSLLGEKKYWLVSHVAHLGHGLNANYKKK